MACLITIGYNQMLQSWLLNYLIDFKVQTKKKFSTQTTYMVNTRYNIPVYYVTNITQLQCFIFSIKIFLKSCKVRATSLLQYHNYSGFIWPFEFRKERKNTENWISRSLFFIKFLYFYISLPSFSPCQPLL